MTPDLALVSPSLPPFLGKKCREPARKLVSEQTKPQGIN